MFYQRTYHVINIINIIVMVSECDFDNMTCVWSCNVYASLKRDLCLKHQDFSFLYCFLSSSVYVYQ